MSGGETEMRCKVPRPTPGSMSGPDTGSAAVVAVPREYLHKVLSDLELCNFLFLWLKVETLTRWGWLGKLFNNTNNKTALQMTTFYFDSLNICKKYSEKYCLASVLTR